MKKITAVTLFQTAVGYRLSMVYSEINEEGVIIKDNVRIDRILVDQDVIGNATALMSYAQRCVDKHSGDMSRTF